MSLLQYERTPKIRLNAMRHRMQKRSPLDLIHALGPYLLIELLLPGGSLIAGVLYLVRNRKCSST